MRNRRRKRSLKYQRRTRPIVWSVVISTLLLLCLCVGIVFFQGWTIGTTTVVFIATILGVVINIVSLVPAFLQLQEDQNENPQSQENSGLVRLAQTTLPQNTRPLSSSQPLSEPFNSSSGGSALSSINNLLIFEEDENLQNTPFLGRDSERENLARVIVQNRCRVVALFGQGGIGKTSLAIKVVKQIKNNFDEIIGISLRSAPPLKNVIYECVQKLSNYTEINLANSTEDGIRMLLELLYKKRCLLFFDNGESILQVNNHYIPNYEEYGDFFKLLAEAEHKSCLLITSRDIYREIQLLEGKFVFIYKLHGLDTAEGKKLLDMQNLRGNDDVRDQLISLYGGNPLALKLASGQIRDLNSGNIESFLSQDIRAVDEIDELLKQQFERLSSLEMHLMNCLAIALEPITQTELRDGHFHNVSWQHGNLERALRNLKNCDLIATGENKIFLQSVIMEYTLRNLVKKACEEIRELSFEVLEHYAFLKASGQDYVRESQVRLILVPLLKDLSRFFDREELENIFKRCLATLRQSPSLYSHSSYAAGNVINLWIQGGLSVKGADFSGLQIHQAYFQGIDMQGTNLASSDLGSTVFTDTFGDVFSVDLHAATHGELLAAGTSTNEVRLWKRHLDGNILWRILPAHTDWVRTVAFSPDGQLLASGGDDQYIYIWKIDQYQHFRKEKPLVKLAGHKGRIYSVSFDTDGRSLLSSSQDGTMKLWDIRTGSLVREFHGHKGTIYSATFNPIDQTIISGGEDHTVRIWSKETGQIITTLLEHQDEVKTVTCSPDGTVFVSGSRDRTIRLWDARTYTCQKTLPSESSIGPLLFHSDGQSLLSGEESGLIKHWNCETGECSKILIGHRGRIWTLALSNDKETLVSGSIDQSIRVWNITTGKCIQTQLGKNTWVYAVAFNHHGDMLASGSGGDGKIRLWNPQMGKELKAIQSESWVRAIAFHPNDTILASAGDDTRICLWDIKTGQLLRTLEGHNNTVRTIAFDTTGSILASAGDDQTIRVWNTENGRCEQIIQMPGNIWSIAFHPDGTHIASAGDESVIRIRNLQSLDEETVLEGHTNWIYFVTYSPDGTTLVSCSQDETVRLWPLHSPERSLVLKGHNSWVHAAAFNPDGSLLVTVSQDQSVRLWETHSGSLNSIIGQHTHWVYTVALSSDGYTIASGAGDGVIKLWDIHTKACTHILYNIRPYENMNIIGVRSLEPAQMEILKALGAVEEKRY